MRKIILVVFFITYSLFAGYYVVEQNDWMGGDGVLGPVTDWETQYYCRDSSTTATPGNVSLIATEKDYDAWVCHIISTETIPPNSQGLLPVDIDNDCDKDLIAYIDNSVSWFEYISPFTYVEHTIGAALSSYPSLGVHPADLNDDSWIDVLVVTNLIGAGWYENLGYGANWTWHSLDNSIGYHCIWADDMDNDGDIDPFGVDNSVDLWTGKIILFRNDGSGIFTREEAASNTGFWRLYPADFNGDGFLDLYSSWRPLRVFLNDGTACFNESFYFGSVAAYDGEWASDIDCNGIMDIVVAGSGWFDALINDGTGTLFTRIHLAPGSGYDDGSMAGDIDLDGLPDFGGDFTKVGWFRQNPLSPLTFEEHLLDDTRELDNMHWFYIADVDTACAPDMDILITGDNVHAIFENRMLSAFAGTGYLESSILDIGYMVNWVRIGWQACIPSDSSIAFYWRAGNDSSTITSFPWQGPYWGSMQICDYAESLDISKTARYFQYRVEFFYDKNIVDDIAVLHKFWAVYDCDTVLINCDSVPECADTNDTITVFGENIVPDITVQFGDTFLAPLSYAPDSTWLQFLCPNLPWASYQVRFLRDTLISNCGWIHIPCDTSQTVETIDTCSVHPKPFTPNANDMNEYAKFEYPGMSENKGIVYIYTLENEFVRKVKNGDIYNSPKGVIYWDGRDGYNRLMENGVYLYILQVEGKTVCKGTVYIAR